MMFRRVAIVPLLMLFLWIPALTQGRGRGGQTQQAQQPEVQYVEAPPPAPAEPDLNTQLTQLAQLHDSGILTDEEFAAKKAQILGI